MSLCYLNHDQFLYGEGLFETFPLHDGDLPFFKDHWERLFKSCKILNYPFAFDGQEVKETLIQSAQQSKKQETIVRLTYQISSQNPTLFYQLVPARISPPSWSLLPKAIVPIPNAAHKTTNRHLYKSILEEAESQGFSDALLVTPEGEILETTRANVFVVLRGELHTPKLNGKLLPGVMRNQAIKQAQRLGVSVVEKELRIKDLTDAEEVFVTNSVIGILSVIEIEGVWKGEENSGLLSNKFELNGL